jgi:hypothetical protein
MCLTPSNLREVRNVNEQTTTCVISQHKFLSWNCLLTEGYAVNYHHSHHALAHHLVINSSLIDNTWHLANRIYPTKELKSSTHVCPTGKLLSASGYLNV